MGEVCKDLLYHVMQPVSWYSLGAAEVLGEWLAKMGSSGSANAKLLEKLDAKIASEEVAAPPEHETKKSTQAKPQNQRKKPPKKSPSTINDEVDTLSLAIHDMKTRQPRARGGL